MTKQESYATMARKVGEALQIASSIGDFNTDHHLRIIYHKIIEKQKLYSNN